MIYKIKKKIRITLAKIKGKLKLYYQKKIYVSFGENCLTDNILERHNLKVLTTPFSHGRSNIEYILQLERDNYKDFLNRTYLQYEILDDTKIPRLKKYDHIYNDYHELHKNGFEFTHHDVIKDEKIRQKMKERLDKLQDLVGKKKFVILYHHRVNKESNVDLLLENLNELKGIYSRNNKRSEVVCFTQNIISSINERKLSYIKRDEIHYFVFNTFHIWEGNDPKLLWAKKDEDLIIEMLNLIKKI